MTIAGILASAEPWDRDSISQIFKNRNLDDIEGVWQFPNDGPTMLIHRSSSTNYEIVLLDSPALDIKPCSVIGQAVITADSNKYDAHLQSKPLGDKRIKRTQAVFTVKDGNTLSIKPYSTGKKISLKRWIPYYLRVTITDQKAPDGLIVAKKIYPIDMLKYKPCF